jgi:malate dehydrogenase (oxaloacetate-decarboxylating)
MATALPAAQPNQTNAAPAAPSASKPGATKLRPSAAFSVTIRFQLNHLPGVLGKLTTAIGVAGGDIAAVDLVQESRDWTVRDIAIDCRDAVHQRQVVDALRFGVEGVTIQWVRDNTFALHDGGKLTTGCKTPLKSPNDLSMAYTPGVARICLAIGANKALSHKLTVRKNTVAVVSDGTAILGLGDISPEAAMPVMEGKAQLFKEFGGVDATPICIDTKDPAAIIDFVRKLAPSFGGINLEDISAPRCFEIEDALQDLGIPVFHDDQHGTAIVMQAGLTNAVKLVGKRMEDLKVVVCGVGAAGVACSKIMMAAGVKNIIGCDRSGAIYQGRSENMNPVKDWYAANTNPQGLQGSVSEVVTGADVFIGVSAPGMLSVEDVKRMAPKAIVFAMSNPIPEIMPEVAGPHVAVMATGRSDYPNQINNVLAFPGIFRGALDVAASRITQNMKLAASKAIADLISADQLSPECIVPTPFDRRVGPAVARAVAEQAVKDGVARLGLTGAVPYEEIRW